MAPGRAGRGEGTAVATLDRRVAGQRAEREGVLSAAGLTVASFYAWRRVLQRRAAEQPAFLPVQVVADAVPAQASALEVILTDGRTVRVAPGFDAATLRRLLAVLEGEGRC